eukprot:3201066-Lingulodinium_polyedra.AAC.1
MPGLPPVPPGFPGCVAPQGSAPLSRKGGLQASPAETVAPARPRAAAAAGAGVVGLGGRRAVVFGCGSRR